MKQHYCASQYAHFGVSGLPTVSKEAIELNLWITKKGLFNKYIQIEASRARISRPLWQKMSILIFVKKHSGAALQ